MPKFARGDFVRVLRRLLRDSPTVRRRLADVDTLITRQRQSVAAHFPMLIQPQPRLLTVAIAAKCNLRCIGCRMAETHAGATIAAKLVVDLLHDATAAGFHKVRLYGGEPLLHRDLPKMIQVACGLGLIPYITTNAVLLGEKIDELYDAGPTITHDWGLRDHSSYDQYVQRADSYERWSAVLPVFENAMVWTYSCRATIFSRSSRAICARSTKPYIFADDTKRSFR